MFILRTRTDIFILFQFFGFELGQHSGKHSFSQGISAACPSIHRNAYIFVNLITNILSWIFKNDSDSFLIRFGLLFKSMLTLCRIAFLSLIMFVPCRSRLKGVREGVAVSPPFDSCKDSHICVQLELWKSTDFMVYYFLLDLCRFLYSRDVNNLLSSSRQAIFPSITVGPKLFFL